MKSLPKVINILLVEDSETDRLIAVEALQQSKLKNQLHMVKDGVEALAFLRRQEGFSNAPVPDLILLDLNLPRKSGREVLEEIKADNALKSIPVVVLTTSRDDEDVLASYSLHANCYISKPVDFDKFVEVVKSVEHFWFTVVTLPTKED